MVKPLHPQCRGTGSIPGQDPAWHTVRPKKKRIVITVFSWRLEVKCLEQREPFSLTRTKALMGERPLMSTGAGPIQPSVQVTAVLLRGMTPETGQRAAVGL